MRAAIAGAKGETVDSCASRQRRRRSWHHRPGEETEPQHGRRAKGAGRGDSGKLTAARTVAALGAVLAEDLRDPDGFARPLLRRAAVRMIASRQKAVRRLGTTYLRRDPPTPEDLSAGHPRQAGVTLPSEPRQLLLAAPTQEADGSDVEAARPEAAEPRPEGAAPV